MWKFNVFGYELYYVFYAFFIYSFIGWIYESTVVSISKKTLVNRGFLNGPIIPIYGSGAMLIFLVFGRCRYNFLLVYAGSVLLATILEYLTSLAMELLFHAKWWDYSKHKFNLNGRICLAVSLLWGVLAIAELHIIHPGVNRLILLIPRDLGELVGCVIFLLFITDITVTTIYTVKLDLLLEKLNQLRKDMLEYITSNKLYETGDELKEKLSGLRLSGIFKEIRGTLDEKFHNITKQLNKPETKTTEEESRIKEFLLRYQSLAAQKIQVRLLKAFPSMKAGRRDAALRDLREKLKKEGSTGVEQGLKGRGNRQN